MEFNKINNLLDSAHDKVPRFITKKWIEVQSQSGNTYNTSKPIRFKTSMLRSDLCDYSDAYVWVKGKIIVTNLNDNANFNKELALKNNARFISCISKINSELVENGQDVQCLCTICSNTVKIMKKLQDLCLIIIEMNQKNTQ